MGRNTKYKMQAIDIPITEPANIPGITTPQTNYGVSIGGKDRPENGATKGANWLTNLVGIPTDLFQTLANTLDDIANGTTYAKVLSTDISDGHILLSSVDGTLDNIDDGETYGRVLLTGISAGKIVLAQVDGNLDDIAEGTSYGKVLLTAISAGNILLSSTIEDETYKKYTTTEQTKLSGIEGGATAGAAWGSNLSGIPSDIFYKLSNTLDDIPEGVTYGKVNLTSISAGNILLAEVDGTLDDLDDGETYGKILLTSISAGKILLAQVDGTLDDVAEGTTYGKVALTDISAGHILLQVDQNLGTQGIKIVTGTTGARVELLPDASTGLNILDADGNPVFVALIGGTNSGDVIIGNYSGGQGLLYDKSAGKMFYKNLAWSEVVDDDGNAPADNATVGATAGSNLFGSNADVLGDDDVKNIETFTEGETLAVGKIACIKNLADASIITIIDDAWVNGALTERDTNYGTNALLRMGVADFGGGNATHRFFMKIPTAGAPSVYKIQKVELKIYVRAKVGDAANAKIQTCNAAWDPSTITYNNAPAVTDNLSTYYTTSTVATIPGAGNWLTFDITELFKAWENGDLTNNGFEVACSASAGTNYVELDSYDGTNKPQLEITYAGNSDGEAYLADNDDYNLCRTILGIVKARNTGAGTCVVQKFGRAVISSSGTKGNVVFLGNTGEIHTGGAYEDRQVKIGKIMGADNTVDLNVQTEGILIKKELLPAAGLVVTFGTTLLHPMIDCRRCKIWVEVGDGIGGTFKGHIEVFKDNLSGGCKIFLSASRSVTIAWANVSSIGFSRENGGEDLTIKSVEYYN